MLRAEQFSKSPQTNLAGFQTALFMGEKKTYVSVKTSFIVDFNIFIATLLYGQVTVFEHFTASSNPRNSIFTGTGDL